MKLQRFLFVTAAAITLLSQVTVHASEDSISTAEFGAAIPGYCSMTHLNDRIETFQVSENGTAKLGRTKRLHYRTFEKELAYRLKSEKRITLEQNGMFSQGISPSNRIEFYTVNISQVSADWKRGPVQMAYEIVLRRAPTLNHMRERVLGRYASIEELPSCEQLKAMVAEVEKEWNFAPYTGKLS